MARRKIAIEDRMEITDVLARYCWHVDEGETEEWVDLWTDDGVFAGISKEPKRGREQLKEVPPRALAAGSRHKVVNLLMEYGDTDDDIIVRGYSLVTSWLAEPAFICNSVVRYHMVREGDTWKIKSNQVRNLISSLVPRDDLPPGFPTPANQPTTWPPL